jgi:hypothetical protein
MLELLPIGAAERGADDLTVGRVGRVVDLFQMAAKLPLGVRVASFIIRLEVVADESPRSGNACDRPVLR